MTRLLLDNRAGVDTRDYDTMARKDDLAMAGLLLKEEDADLTLGPIGKQKLLYGAGANWTATQRARIPAGHRNERRGRD